MEGGRISWHSVPLSFAYKPIQIEDNVHVANGNDHEVELL